MYFKFILVLCVTGLLLTSALAKPLADRYDVIADEVETPAPLMRLKRQVMRNGKCPNGEPKVLGNCTPKDSDYD